MAIAVVAMLALQLLVTTAAAAVTLGPGGDWCAAVQALEPGDELVLEPGEYVGSCTIRRGGMPGAPVVIRARDRRDPPRIFTLGGTDNVLNVRASHVVLRGLQFGPTLTDVDAIRIHGGADITVESCRFVDLGGIAIVANSGPTRRLTVRGNEIVRSRLTAMYFGCHDGVACTASDLVIDRNYIHGVEAPEPQIGYGIQVKLNSTATIRDNVVVDTKGPGIMVYGAADGSQESVVERNFVAGSRTSSGIVVGGGPAIVRNNVAIANADAGIALEDYGRRGLLAGVVVIHNTVYGNAQGGILLVARDRRAVTIVNNAAQARTGRPAFPAPAPGVSSAGNVECGSALCFAAPDALDFSPIPGSPLTLRGRIRVESWAPLDDFFGHPRGAPPAAGAVEQPSAPIAIGLKGAIGAPEARRAPY